jgi:hypothetical protein
VIEIEVIQSKRLNIPSIEVNHFSLILAFGTDQLSAVFASKKQLRHWADRSQSKRISVDERISMNRSTV